MEARLQAFAARLRDNGLRVSTAELVDAGRALEVVGLGERERVRDALCTTLVKRAGDVPIFEALFDLHFADPGAATLPAGDLLEALARRGLSAADRARLAEVLAGLPAGDLARALLEGRRLDLVRALQAAAAAAGLDRMVSFMQQGIFGERLLRGAGLGVAETELEAMLGALEAAGVSETALEEIRALLHARVRDLRLLARRQVEAAWAARHVADGLTAAGAALEDRPLYTLTRAEIERMKAVVTRMAERLRERIERRRKVVRRGQLDVHKTLRRAARYGGLPLEPVYKKKRRDRPDLVVLVDVSDSVRNVARFFLQFAYTLQDVFDRVRSFVFVADLGEATRLFEEADVHRAIDLAFTGRVVSLAMGSNYGRALTQFHRDHLGAVTHRTTVFILGDGRNNRNPPHDWVLADIHRRARRLVWLCPEDRLSWGFGDSEMPAYARHCDYAEPVRRLSDLERVVEQVLT